jgi:hypothetical protein
MLWVIILILSSPLILFVGIVTFVSVAVGEPNNGHNILMSCLMLGALLFLWGFSLTRIIKESRSTSK